MNFSVVKDHILRCLNNEEYDELKSYLSNYSSKEMHEFFLQKGRLIFSWSLNYCQNSTAVAFLVRNTPIEIIERILSEENFFMVVCFLRAQENMVKGDFYNEEKKKVITEKINYLLKIGNIGINKAIEDNLNTDLIAGNVRPNSGTAKLKI